MSFGVTPRRCRGGEAIDSRLDAGAGLVRVGESVTSTWTAC
jgi:hypothetical protein